MKSNSSNPQDVGLAYNSFVLFNHPPQPGFVIRKEGTGSMSGERLQSVFITAVKNAPQFFGRQSGKSGKMHMRIAEFSKLW